MSPCGGRPLLVHVGLVDHVTPETKRILVEDMSTTRTAILSDDAVGSALSAFNHRSAVPSRRFTHEDDAITSLTDDLVFAAALEDR